jgi:hypothetical protein
MTTKTYLNCIKNSKKGPGLCPRGYCTAKLIFKAYPSAYANGYATQVCKGKKPDFLHKTREDIKYGKTAPSSAPLARWFNEKWVNVCKKGSSAGGYAPCGRSNNNLNVKEKYPYCRPYYKLPGTTVKTVKELTKAERKHMCDVKKDSGSKRIYISKEF